jgi:hypothetical protein
VEDERLADRRFLARAPGMILRIVLIGTALGFVALGLFAGLHAIVIKPVWSELAQGIPFVIAIGVSVTWAYHEFVKTVPKAVCSTGGMRFGALMWFSALPAIALASWMRVKYGTASPPAWLDAVAAVLALAGGALALWSVTRSRRTAIAGAIAALVLLAAGGGPLPVIRGGRVLELWFGLFVLETLGGALLAQLYKRWGRPSSPVTAPQSAG